MKKGIALLILLVLSIAGLARPDPTTNVSVTTLTGVRPVRHEITVEPGATSLITIPLEGVTQGNPCSCGFQEDYEPAELSGAITISCYAVSPDTVQFVLTNHTQQAIEYGDGTARAVCWQFDVGE